MEVDKLMFKSDLLANERILVTGGGTGLGKEMAEGFLALGAEVHICGRRGGVCEETAKALMDQHGGKVVPHGCDIRSPDSISKMNDEIWADNGPLTGLVNNAAGNFISRTEDLSTRGFDAIANIVFRGSFYMTHDVGTRWIKEKRRGNVVSILTTWVWNGGPFTVPSAMSKAGLRSMTESLASEWGRYGLRFNAIAPGPFPTEGAAKRLAPGVDSFEAQSAQSPMGRIGEMHELVNLAVLLMGPGAEYINGQTVNIDGGEFNAGIGNFYALTKWGDAEWQAAREAIQKTNEKDKAQRTA